MAGKPGRSGPKPGNLNALKNGSRLSRQRLTVGELPRSMISVKREARAYRRYLERTVLEAKRVIDDEDLHLIDAAVGATMAVGVNRWLLRNRLDKMTVADIRACNKEMRDAKRDRAKIVKELGLRVQPEPMELKDYIEAEHTDGAGGTDK